jgi:hypothetical protein
LGYSQYDGDVFYFNPDATPDKQLLRQMTNGNAPDYTNSKIEWGDLQAPDNETSFDELSDLHKKVVAESLGYKTYDTTVYYNENASDKPFLTNFVQGVDYTNESVGLSDELTNDRWLIKDGDTQYMIQAVDSDGNGEYDQIEIQDMHPLYGQRGFGHTYYWHHYHLTG